MAAAVAARPDGRRVRGTASVPQCLTQARVKRKTGLGLAGGLGKAPFRHGGPQVGRRFKPIGARRMVVVMNAFRINAGPVCKSDR
jgi:hypothetical protein